MPRIGLLFPGQGAQFIGMGRDWFEQYDAARKIYESADQILGFPISQICFQGPDDTLTRTLNAQPAIFVTSLAIYSVLKEKWSGFEPDFAAGLSLGEFTALVASGALSFADGLKLVRARAELMEKASEKNQGTMASVLGLHQEQCEAIAKESGAELANLNAPDQFVFSGKLSVIEQSIALAESRGAKRAIRLKVGGAFHSSLMEEARTGLQQALKKINIQTPGCMFVANASASLEDKPERIRHLLGEQLVRPVRWLETMEIARQTGIQRFIEPGPGRVLKGLAKRIDPSLEVFSLEKTVDVSTLDTAFQSV